MSTGINNVGLVLSASWVKMDSLSEGNSTVQQESVSASPLSCAESVSTMPLGASSSLLTSSWCVCPPPSELSRSTLGQSVADLATSWFIVPTSSTGPAIEQRLQRIQDLAHLLGQAVKIGAKTPEFVSALTTMAGGISGLLFGGVVGKAWGAIQLGSGAKVFYDTLRILGVKQEDLANMVENAMVCNEIVQTLNKANEHSMQVLGSQLETIGVSLETLRGCMQQIEAVRKDACEGTLCALAIVDANLQSAERSFGESQGLARESAALLRESMATLEKAMRDFAHIISIAQSGQLQHAEENKIHEFVALCESTADGMKKALEGLQVANQKQTAANAVHQRGMVALKDALSAKDVAVDIQTQYQIDSARQEQEAMEALMRAQKAQIEAQKQKDEVLKRIKQQEKVLKHQEGQLSAIKKRVTFALYSFGTLLTGACIAAAATSLLGVGLFSSLTIAAVSVVVLTKKGAIARGLIWVGEKIFRRKCVVVRPMDFGGNERIVCHFTFDNRSTGILGRLLGRQSFTKGTFEVIMGGVAKHYAIDYRETDPLSVRVARDLWKDLRKGVEKGIIQPKDCEVVCEALTRREIFRSNKRGSSPQALSTPAFTQAFLTA